MCAFVLSGLGFSVPSLRETSWGNVSEMTYFVSSGTRNHNAVKQSVNPGVAEGFEKWLRHGGRDAEGVEGVENGEGVSPPSRLGRLGERRKLLQAEIEFGKI